MSKKLFKVSISTLTCNIQSRKRCYIVFTACRKSIIAFKERIAMRAGNHFDTQFSAFRLQQAAFDASLKGDLASFDAASRELVEIQRAAAGASATEAEIASTVRQQRGVIQSPWFQAFLELDAREPLREVEQPVLVLNGELDTQVLADQNVPAIEAALKHNDDVEVRVLPGLNHLFQPATTGAFSEYAEIEVTFDPGALEIISGWIRRR